MKNLGKAIKAWNSVLSKGSVVTDKDILAREGTATFATSQKIYAIVKPSNTDEVSAILKIATANRVPVFPISGGKNWGLGSKVPQRDGVLMDLSRMKRVRAFSEQMAYMTVEPGVTFGAAVDYLLKKKSGLMLDTIGSTPDASIIGNTAERGHGMALHADRFNFVCGLEVVLPGGEIIHTGFEGVEGSQLGPLAKWGLGPYIDGLFTQSNLGVITALTIWLRPKSNHFQSFIFHVNDEKNLALLMDRWREMTLEGLQASLRIFNDIRMVSFARRFPENATKPLSESTLEKFRKGAKIGKWIGLGAVYPVSPLHAKADREFILSRMGDLVDSIEFYEEERVNAEYDKTSEEGKRFLDFIFNKSLLRGNVSKAGLNMVYWRKPESIAIGDLHEDRCGVLWYCPAIPFTGKDVSNAVRICHKLCRKHGFELNIGFLFISQRTLDITGGLCYDRNVKGEDRRAMACHDEIMTTLNAAGYSPYRLGIQSMKMMKTKSKTALNLVRKIKSTLDPHDILAPGHYESSF
jgi:4-cresol dehydrogenase (hydroxylating) flavoprotein subunit